MYSRQVLEQFQNTRNVGELEQADAYVRVDNPACGDILQLAIKVSEGRVTAVRFRVRGCVAAVACAAQMTEMIEGKTFAEVRALRRENLIDALGGLPPASEHASALAIEAISSALKQLLGSGR